MNGDSEDNRQAERNVQQPLHWSEGMFLRSHHLQQWDAFQENRQHRWSEILEPDSWGVMDLAVDDTALQSERFEVERCRLVFRSGAVVAYPGNAIRPARSFEGRLKAAGATLPIHVGIRPLDPDRPNIRDLEEENTGVTRFRVLRREVKDLQKGEDPQWLEFLEFDLRVLFDDDEDLGRYETIRVARLERGGQQSRPFMISKDFSPPCLRVGASTALQALVEKVVAAVLHKAVQLHESKVQLFSGDGPKAMMNLHLLQALQSHYPVLKSEVEPGLCHPRRAFAILSSLAGAIGALKEKRDPRHVHGYEHADPMHAFTPLCVQILSDLQEGEGEYDFLDLRGDGNYFFADVPSSFLDPALKLYLVVRSARPSTDVVDRLRKEMKITSRGGIDELVQKFRSGLGFAAVNPPPEYKADPDQVFFLLTFSGQEASRIQKDGTFAAYLPTGDPATTASLVVIRRGEDS